MSEELHLSPAELAARWGKREGTLSNWRLAGTGPKFIKFGKRVLYPLAALEAFEREHGITPR